MSRTRRENVLRALESGPKTTAELCQPDVGGSRFGARLQELREAGYFVSTERLGPSSALYRLTGRPNTRDDVELTCSRLHTWYGRCRRDSRGYPMIAGSGPNCPTCGREPMAVEAFIGPARPSVIERAAA